MAAPEPPPTPAESTVKIGAAPALDILSKALAAFVILTYGCGFLVISLHNFTYGYMQTNPFRPRIISAGAWFLFLTGMPVALVMSYQNLKQSLEWADIGGFLYLYYVACASITIPASAVFEFPDPREPVVSWHWWKVVVLLVALAVLILIQMKQLPKWLSVTTSIACVSYFSGDSLRSMILAQQFQWSALTLWFFAIGCVTLIVSKLRWKRLSEDAWARGVFLVLSAISFFAVFYYPHIKASWGGGTPIPVTIFLTKDSPLKPSQSISALLLDEADAGLYIVGRNDKKAIFVPRSLVALLYFSDKESESSLLRNRAP